MRDVPRCERLQINDNTNLNTLLSLALKENVNQSFVVKFFKEKLHPYKVQLIHEQSGDDPDR